MERRRQKVINNTFYDTLHEKWHEATDHPIALLRAENKIRNPWILGVIQEKIGKSGAVLDIGCGAGFLTNFLAINGYQVQGIDLSEHSLKVAEEKDVTKSVIYTLANATSLPFADNTFDVVAAMDLLEHVEDPEAVIKEAGRVLKPGGLFFFHTFNRNPLSYLLIIKGVEWGVKNAPKNMHVYSLFIKPKELSLMCEKHHLKVEKWLGLRPDFSQFSFWKMALTRSVDEAFRFTFTSSLATGYVGYSLKQ